jgi:APA family basic amino acid/polyamine antiporter
VVVALGALVMDVNMAYDLTNIGTLFAFVVVCVGVLVLRLRDPDRPRPFRVPWVFVLAPLGAGACIYTMFGLPHATWTRFAIWMAIGLVIYLCYGMRHSRLRAESQGGSAR